MEIHTPNDNSVENKRYLYYRDKEERGVKLETFVQSAKPEGHAANPKYQNYPQWRVDEFISLSAYRDLNQHGHALGIEYGSSPNYRRSYDVSHRLNKRVPPKQPLELDTRFTVPLEGYFCAAKDGKRTANIRQKALVG